MKQINADVYDTVEMSAEAYDGIGAGSNRRYDSKAGQIVPNCLLGHIEAAAQAGYPQRGELAEMLDAVREDGGSTEGLNDDAVRRINRRKGTTDYLNTPVTFPEYCEERGWERASA